jgi:hypothetical protein
MRKRKQPSRDTLAKKKKKPSAGHDEGTLEQEIDRLKCQRIEDQNAMQKMQGSLENIVALLTSQARSSLVSPHPPPSPPPILPPAPPAPTFQNPTMFTPNPAMMNFSPLQLPVMPQYLAYQNAQQK